MSSADDVAANVAAWTRKNAEYLDGAAERAWAREEISWGAYGVPESELGILGDAGSWQTIVAPRGHHEPFADTSPQIAFELLARTRDVLAGAREEAKTDFVAVVQNYGLQAGAQTDHLCFDFYDLPQIPHRIGEELDYELEATAQQAFADAYAGDPGISVPGVVAASSHVLVTEWMDGTPLSKIISEGSQAERDRAVDRLKGIDRMTARDRDPGRGAHRLAAGEDPADHLERQLVERHADQRQGEDRARAHGVDVRQRVGRSDAAEVERIVDDRGVDLGGRRIIKKKIEHVDRGGGVGLHSTRQVGRHGADRMSATAQHHTLCRDLGA